MMERKSILVEIVSMYIDIEYIHRYRLYPTIYLSNYLSIYLCSDGKKEYPCGECEYIAGDF